MEQTMKKEPKIEYFHFVIDGEFITQTARTWFWDENRPYEKAEELIKSCLINDQITDDERTQLAQMIIEGRKKITGRSDTGLFVEDDNQNVRPILLKMQELEKKLFIEQLKTHMEYDFLPFVDPYATVKSISAFRHISEGMHGIEDCNRYFLYYRKYDDRSFMEDEYEKATKGGLWLYDHPSLVYEVMQEMYPDTKPDVSLIHSIASYESGSFWERIYQKIKDSTDPSFRSRNERYLGYCRMKKQKREKEEKQNALLIYTKDEMLKNPTKVEETLYAYESVQEIGLLKKYKQDQIQFLDQQLKKIQDGVYGKEVQEHADFYKFEYELMKEYCPPGVYHGEVLKSDENLMYQILPDIEPKMEYGLCDPMGNWYSCGFGGHNIKARHLIYAYPERFPDAKPGKMYDEHNMFQDSEALDIILKSGWCVLRYDTSRGYYLNTPMSIGVSKNITKAQKDRIWDIIVRYDIHMDTDEIL